MRVYHVCQCCDLIYKVTTLASTEHDPAGGAEDNSGGDHSDDQTLTVSVTASIINPISGRSEKITVGLCDECREEVYGSSSWQVMPHLLH